jgi:hypothetical protein
VRFTSVLPAAVATIFIACSDNDDGNPSPPTIGPPIAIDRCTPEFAGYGDAPLVEFSHFLPPKLCVFDIEARDATCDISGCTVASKEEWIEREDQIAPYLTCEPGAPASSGIDFTRHRGLFVRQGMRIGEWMKREPVVWVVEDADGKIIVAEKRRSFCITGGDVNGGVVAYVVLLPASTASTSVERRAYRNPNGCDMCSGENDCSG